MPEEPSTDDEQISEEGGEIEDSSEEEITPVTDSAEDQDEEPVEDSEAVPADEEEQDEPEETEGVSNSIMAAEKTDSTITVKYADDGAEASDKATAEVTFLGGCVGSDGKLVKNADLTFKVEPNDGKVLGDVKIKIGENGTDTKVERADGKDYYSVDKASFVDGDNALSATITVNTTTVKYTANFSATDSGASVYAVTKGDDGKDSLADAASTNAEIKYGETAEVIIVPAENKKIRSVKVGEADVEIVSGKTMEFGEDDAKKAYPVYKIDPSKATSLDKNGDDSFTVTITAEAAATLTVATDIKGDGKDKVEFGAATGLTDTDKYVNYSNGLTITEDTADASKKLAFTVAPKADAEGVKVDTVTAAIGKESVAVDKVADHYEIDLSKITIDAVKTLTITATSAYDEEDDSVHVLTFVGTGITNKYVDVKSGASVAPAKVVTQANTYSFTVEPKAGYEIAKGTKEAADNQEATKDAPAIKVEYTKEYTVTDDDAKSTVEKKVEAEYLVANADSGEAETIALTLSASDTDYEAEATTAMPFTVKAVKVTIDADAIAVTDAKTVTFDTTNAEYKVTGDKNVKAVDDEDDTYTIEEGAKFVTFEVKTTGLEPTVTYLDGGNSSQTVENPEPVEGVYTYSIPASDIGDKTRISIEANANNKKVTIKADTDEVDFWYDVKEDDDAYDMNGNAATDEDGQYAYTVLAGNTVTLTFEPKTGSKIEQVTYKIGEAGPKTAAIKDGKVVITEKVTDNITVEVTSSSEYSVILTANAEGEDLELPKNNKGEYIPAYDAKNIKVELLKNSTIETIYDIIVKDGNSTAATRAEVADNGTYATIASIDASEIGKSLTVEVYIRKDAKTTLAAKATIVSTKVSSKVIVKDGKKTVSAVTMPVDSQVVYTVTPDTGCSVDDLEAEITKEDGSAFETTAVPATVVLDGNELTITTKPGKEAVAEKAVVSIYNKNAKKKDADGKETAGVDKTTLTGGKITVTIGDPIVKGKKAVATMGSAGNRSVKVNLSTAKKDNIVKPVVGNIFYKVEVELPAAPEGVTYVAAGDLTKYYEVDYDNPTAAVTKEIKVVDSVTGDDPATELLKDAPAIEGIKVHVTLVQSTTAQTAATVNANLADCVLGDVVDLNAATKEAFYETKLSYKKGTTTIYTGQQDVTVATPKFTTPTTFTDVTVEFVDTKNGGALDDDYDGPSKTETYDYYGTTYTAAVDEDGTVKVSVDLPYSGGYASIPANLGVRIHADAPQNGYAASAVVKLSIVRGIERIYIATPENLYVKDLKKGASLKLAPVLNGGSKNYTPKSKKVQYFITDEDGLAAGTADCGLSDEVQAKVTVKANGTVTVAKNYVPQKGATKDEEKDNNSFYVTAVAADYNNSEVEYTTAKITISTEAQEISKLVVMKGSTVLGSGAVSLKAEDFSSIYVAALRSGADEKNLVSTDYLPVTLKSGNKAVSVYQSGNRWGLSMTKPANNVKLTATTTDGGKKTATVTLNIAAYEDLGLQITETDTGAVYGPTETAISYSGSANAKYSLRIMQPVADGWTTSDYTNYSVSVKGGKVIKDSGLTDAHTTCIIVNSAKATITLKDKANKKFSKTYTIENKNFKTTKAPKISTKDKITSGWGSISYQVTDAANGNYAGRYVQLAPDWTDVKNAYNTRSDIFNYNNSSITRIDDSGIFTLNPYLEAGSTYKLVATVGDMEQGEFVPAAKDVKLTIKVPKAKTVKLKVPTSYKLDAKANASAEITIDGYNYTVSETMNVVLKAQGRDAHTNNFKKYFDTRYEGGKYYIGLNSTLTSDDLAYITNMSDKTAKADREGYITVTEDEGSYRKDFKITISFNNAKYSSAGATVYKEATTTATISVLNGKTPVKVAFAAVDSADAKTAASGFAVPATNGIVDGNIVLNSTTAEAGKTYNVKLYVVPADSAYVTENAGVYAPIAGLDQAKLLTADYAVPVTAKIIVKDKTDAKLKKITVSGNSLKVKLTPDDYNSDDKKYEKKVAYTLPVSNTTVKDLEVAEAYRGFVTAAKENGKIKLSVDKAGLATAVAAEKPVAKYGKESKVDVKVNYTDATMNPDTLQFKITMPAKAQTFDEAKKAVSDAKASIDALRVDNNPYYYADAEDILEDLRDRVETKVASYVKKDSDVAVTAVVKDLSVSAGDEELDTNADEPTSKTAAQILEDGKATIVVTLTNNGVTPAVTSDYTYEYELDKKAALADVDTIASAIKGKKTAIEAQISNDTGRSDLLTIVKGLDGVKENLASNISISVKSFSKTNATEEAPGAIMATILVKDLYTGDEATASFMYSGQALVIAKLPNVNDAVTAVQTATNQTALEGFINKCNAEETLIKNAVLDAAKDEIKTNPALSVGFAKVTDADKATYGEKATECWKYEAPTPAVDATDEQEAVIAKPGSVTYKLAVTKGDQTEACTEVTATIDVTTWKWTSYNDVKKAITDAVTGTDALKTLAESNDGNTIKGAILTAAGKEIKNNLAMTVAYKEKGDDVDFDYQAATAGTNGKLSFTLVLTFEAGGKSDEIGVKDVVVVDADDSLQTPQEVIDSTTCTEVEVASEANNQPGAVAAIKAKYEASRKDAAKSDITVEVEATTEEGDSKTVYTEATEAAAGSITNVKVTVTRTGYEKAETTLTSVAVKLAATSAD